MVKIISETETFLRRPVTPGPGSQDHRKATLFCKGRTINISGCRGHLVSASAAQFCHLRSEAATDNKYIDEWVWPCPSKTLCTKKGSRPLARTLQFAKPCSGVVHDTGRTCRNLCLASKFGIFFSNTSNELLMTRERVCGPVRCSPP